MNIFESNNSNITLHPEFSKIVNLILRGTLLFIMNINLKFYYGINGRIISKNITLRKISKALALTCWQQLHQKILNLI